MQSSTQISRRGLLGAGATLTAASLLAPSLASAAPPSAFKSGGKGQLGKEFAALEATYGVTLGVVASEGFKVRVEYRADELFPMCSLFKMLLVVELLDQYAYDEAYWKKSVSFTAADVVENSTVCAADPDGIMTIDELCDAALRFSDNTAGNLLLKEVGGPAGLTSLLQARGASATRLDRWEPELNSAIPGDSRDTSTPREMHALYTDAILGSRLSTLGRARLQSWMLRNTTSGQRIGAAVDEGELADKTGAGAYGVVNDAGVVFLGESTVSLAIMTRTSTAGATNNNKVVELAAEKVLDRYL